MSPRLVVFGGLIVLMSVCGLSGTAADDSGERLYGNVLQPLPWP